MTHKEYYTLNLTATFEPETAPSGWEFRERKSETSVSGLLPF